MNEYNLETKMNWITDMICCGQTGLVSGLFDDVPKPAGSKMRMSLPVWDLLPLHCKLPELGIPGFNFSRGKAGRKLPTDPDADFITYDPNFYEYDCRKYDSLNDPHLFNFFKSKNIRKFLKKVGILSADNYPKCSVAAMNEHRSYLNRIHKSSVKKEHTRFLDKNLEKSHWKEVQINTTRNYFKNVQKEERLMKMASNRKKVAALKRYKELEPIIRTKRWEKRLADFEEEKKDNEMVRDAIITKKRKYYQEVLARGRENAEVRPLQTMVKARIHQLRRDAGVRRRNLQKGILKDAKIESYIFNKIFQQQNKMEWTRQLAIHRGKVEEWQRQKKAAKMNEEREKFEEIKRRNVGRTIKEPYEEKDPFKRRAELRKKRNKQGEPLGMGHLLRTLRAVERKKYGPKNFRKYAKIVYPTTSLAEKTLYNIAQQLIKRSVYVSLNFLCRQFATMVMDICLSDQRPTDNDLPTVDQLYNYFPNEQTLRESYLSMDMIPNKEYKTIEGILKNEQIQCDRDTCGLRVFLLEKRNFLTTMLLNAKSMIDLCFDQVEFLRNVGDPYSNTPLIADAVFKNRKIMSMNQVLNKMVTILTSERSVFFNPNSDLSTIVNLLSYAKILCNKNIISKGDEISAIEKGRLPSLAAWGVIKCIHTAMANIKEQTQSEEIDLSDSEIKEQSI